MTAETAERVEGIELPDTSRSEEVPDLEVILPAPGEVVIAGIPCQVKHLKSREFFALMSVITSGLGPAAGEVLTGMTDGAEDQDALAAQVTAMLLMAIPNSADAFLRVAASITEPVSNDKDEKVRFAIYMANPEVEDLLPIIDAVIENEKDNIWSLWGKARAYLARWATAMKGSRT